MKIKIAVVVWGKEYTDFFLNFSLPTQLTSNNLFITKKSSHDFEYLIITTVKDQIKIQTSKIYQQLVDIVPVKFISLKLDSEQNCYVNMTEGHKKAISYAYQTDAGLVFLGPDSIMSDGSIRSLLDYVNKGYKVIATATIRLSKESFVDKLKKMMTLENKDILFHPRNLIKLALSCLHPISHSLFWNNKKLNSWPSQLFWNLNDEGILIKGFHLSPLFVFPQKKINVDAIKNTIDYDFFFVVVSDMNQWKIIEDSDEITLFEISKNDVSFTLKNKSKFETSFWIYNHTKTFHRYFATYSIFLKTCDFKKEWKDIIYEATNIISFLNKSAENNFLFPFISKFICMKILFKKILKKILGKRMVKVIQNVLQDN
jgi:hypothetical protein